MPTPYQPNPRNIRLDRVGLAMQFLVALPPPDPRWRSGADTQDLRCPEGELQRGFPFQAGWYGPEWVVKAKIAQALFKATNPGETVYMDVPTTTDQDMDRLLTLTGAEEAGWLNGQTSRVFWTNQSRLVKGSRDEVMRNFWNVSTPPDLMERFQEDALAERPSGYVWYPVQVQTPFFSPREHAVAMSCLDWAVAAIRRNFKVCVGTHCLTEILFYEKSSAQPLGFPITNRIVSAVWLIENALSALANPARQDRNAPHLPLRSVSKITKMQNELAKDDFPELVDFPDGPLPRVQMNSLPHHLLTGLRIISAYGEEPELANILRGVDNAPSALFHKADGRIAARYLEGTLHLDTLKLWWDIWMCLLKVAVNDDKASEYLGRMWHAQEDFCPTTRASVTRLFESIGLTTTEWALGNWLRARDYTRRPIGWEGILPPL